MLDSDNGGYYLLDSDNGGYYLLKFIGDALLASSIYLLLSYWRFSGFETVPTVIWVFSIVFLPTFLFFSYLRRDYMQKIPRDALDSSLSTIYTFIVAYLVGLMGIIFLIPSHPSRFVLGSFLLVGLPSMTVHRYVFNRFFRDRMITHPHRILFTGAGEVGQEVAEEIEKLYGEQIEVIGFLDDHKDDRVECDSGSYEYEIVGELEDFESVCEATDPDSLFISISNISEDEMLELMGRARSIGLPVKIISDVFDIVAQKVTGGSQEKFPAVEIQDTPVRRTQALIKRSFDLTFSTILLILLSPLYLVFAALIKLESDGPVIFKQKRMKNRNETFTCYKFRTMYQNADELREELEEENEKDGPIFKMANDPRITKVGRFLRYTSLDELPQLLNVYKGDMSLIGPRPPTPDEVEEYEDWQRKRLEGKAGITGLWQVSGRSRLDFEDMCLLDIYYLENWSLWLDFKILLKTIPAVLTGRGAY